MEPDFSKRQFFPGTSGTPFDTFLHLLANLERIPLTLFVVFLIALALIPRPLDWRLDIVHWLFFLGDWILIASLPRFNISYGKPKPVILVLAILRTLINLLNPIVSIPLQIIGTLLVIDGFWIEPHRLKLTKQVFLTNKLKSGAIIRILHLSDLHVERITKRENRIKEYIQELHPDLILFTGDFINLSYLDDPVAQEDTRNVMKDWVAPSGVFVVTGSPAVDLPEIIPNLLSDLPIQWLRNETRLISINNQEFELIGLSCSHKPFLDGQHLVELCSAPTSKTRILMYHSPDLAPITARYGIDLQLSGHTHGGQVRLPVIGALVTGSLYGKRFEIGRYQLEKTTLYVSRGIGLEGAGAPRVRFLCPPEIILWEITGTGKE